MKYSIKEEPDRLFYGYSEVVDLKKTKSTPFSDIWSTSSSQFQMKYYNPHCSSIGLEVYPNNFKELQTFTYSALYPISSTKGLDETRVFKLKGGRFICFETTFQELVGGFTSKAYQYIKAHDIPVSWEYDYEEYPTDFDHQNPSSTVYVCFKYEGELE